ncbi:hypothetical protein BB558_001139 [Smittium angustum]|uniref:Peroxisomal multifunctional enzyme type 2-like N-terminal domain-containing protein n=1 Tax=Smittium angustum TaxID=133377 RepID=A0A2U1JC88_SMIAN|nr:hypothetical protein BB558_006852 [Smittium angustum]PWA02716.1 hypothetical protein BB558_001139 [Smittium angustum]
MSISETKKWCHHKHQLICWPLYTKNKIRVNFIAPNDGTQLTATIFIKKLLVCIKPEYVAPFIGFLCHNSCPDSGKIFQIESIRDKWSVITNFDDGRAQWLTSSGDFNKVVVGNIMRVLNVKIGETSTVKKKITARDQNATIEIEAARKYFFQPKNFAFTERNVMLYAFDIVVSCKDLPLVYELSQKFHAFPTLPILIILFCGFNPMMLLHGKEFVQIHSPIPISGNFVCTSQVIDIADKKKASAVTMKLSIKDQSGKLIAEVESSTFIRGIGGFSKVPGYNQPSPPVRSSIAVANASPPKNIHQDVV